MLDDARSGKFHQIERRGAFTHDHLDLVLLVGDAVPEVPLVLRLEEALVDLVKYTLLIPCGRHLDLTEMLVVIN